jgi:quinol monooxygenase YgiN
VTQCHPVRWFDLVSGALGASTQGLPPPGRQRRPNCLTGQVGARQRDENLSSWALSRLGSCRPESLRARTCGTWISTGSRTSRDTRIRKRYASTCAEPSDTKIMQGLASCSLMAQLVWSAALRSDHALMSASLPCGDSWLALVCTPNIWGVNMIASLLKTNGPRDDEMFKKFVATTPGVVRSYQLQSPDNPNDVAVFTVWQDEKARDAFNSSAQRAEVDKAYPGASRTVYRVLNSKS